MNLDDLTRDLFRMPDHPSTPPARRRPMTSFKITRRPDGRVIAVCEQCGATSGTPRSEVQSSRWQRDHGNAHAADPYRARMLAPKGGRA